jgi:hypothetical protein
MKALLPFLAVLIGATAPADRPETYLISIEGIPLGTTDRLTGFSIATWGVRPKAVCRIPSGWFVKAGSSASPEGVIEGGGSHGATWLSTNYVSELDNLVLVTLSEPVSKQEVRSSDGAAVIPATFAGHASISVPDEEEDRRIPLTHANIRLTPAAHCPQPRP